VSMETESQLPNNTRARVKAGYQTLDGHISQIPGLSPSIIRRPEERARGKRVTVQEGDSDYVKLAKQGGHKGGATTLTSVLETLLIGALFILPVTLIYSKEEKNPGAFQALETPFWTDSMSAWERGNGSSNGKQKVSREMLVQLLMFIHFKTVVPDKRPAPVDMSKLLSFGYAEGNKPLQ
uniref:Uncharacterized protein n=1 Tax=Kryptolebias marmoratus TaxID=37003 RepID=A0A3Q3AND1_KRYMA